MKSSTTSKFTSFLTYFSFFLLIISQPLWAQCPNEGDGADDGSDLRISVTPLSPEETEGIEGMYEFTICGKPVLPEIDKFAGYRYFWDFGDGTYSFGEEPHHQYLTDGAYYPKVHLVKAYTSSKSVANQLRTSSPSGGAMSDTTRVDVVGVSGVSSYPPGDGYSLPNLTRTNYDITPAFDLVPGYLQTFVLTFKNDCNTGGSRSVTFSYPQGLFSRDSTIIYTHPDDPSQNSKAFVPPINPPSDADMVYPIIEGEGVSFEEAAGSDYSSLTFSINLPANTTDYVHVFVNLYASPYLPIGEDVNFKLSMGTCPPSSAKGTEMNKSVPVRSSHDPNYKFVDDKSPARDKLTYISGSQPARLTYRLAFQNEGNAAVGEVAVFDTLAEELDFSTFKLLGISLADTNKPKSICDYPPIWRDFIWDDLTDATHYYQMTKDPVKRVVSWKFKTSIMGMQEVLPEDYNSNYRTGDTIPEEWSWGYIDFEIYTKCGLPDQVEFANHAGIVFEDQAPVLTDEVHVRRVCFNNKTFVYTGSNFDLDLVRIANRIYPNAVLDPKTTVITHSDAGIPYPSRLNPNNSNGSEYRYKPNTSRYNRLDTLRIINPRTRNIVLVDNFRYTICDVKARRCYPVSINILISPDGKDKILEYECDGECVPAPAVEDPYPKWWYWLAGIILFILLLLSAFRRGSRRRGRRK